MSHAAHPGGGDGSGGQEHVEYTCERVSQAKVRVMARIGDSLIHSDVFNLDNATARRKFAADLTRMLASTGRGTVDAHDVEEHLLRLVERAAQANDGPSPCPAAYIVVADALDPEENGIYQHTSRGPVQLSNFAMTIERDIAVHDGGEVSRRFEGRIVLHGVESEFSLSSDDYGTKLIPAIHRAAGAKARVLCKPEVLCRAISALSSPVATRITTDFGWAQGGDAYRTPGVTIDAAGIRPAGPADPVRVDLGDEQCARHLDLAEPDPGELAGLKAHIVADLLPLNERRVTSALLAAVGLAVLMPFVKGMNRPAIWLTGLTGGGKSFLGKLFANFFGDFPVADGAQVGSWSSTVNFLQRQGYFFKDAIYLVDDYKPDATHPREVIKLLQNYADNSARGRLRADATTSVSRPIRGILVSTGEDVPEHTPSALARMIVVRVPQVPKDRERGRRCVARCSQYRGVTAALIDHLIAANRTAGFAARVEGEMDDFYGGIQGQQNDVRIAGNFALLMAAFREVAEFLGDAWPGWREQVELFRADLLAVRDEMLAAVRGQQASEVFLATLRDLMQHGHVQVRGWQSETGGYAQGGGRPTIGRRVPGAPCQGGNSFMISTALALAAVQESLRKQGKPLLAATEKALIAQLVGDGKLLDKEGQPIPPAAGGDRTWAAKVDGATKKVFRIRDGALLGDAADSPGDTAPDDQPSGAVAGDAPGDQPQGGA